MLFQREIKVKKKIEVCVVGGGPAGCAAALAAARGGAKVFLAEAHTCLGGLGTAGGVPFFMTFSDGEKFIADGIGHEVMDRMVEYRGSDIRENNIHADSLKRVYEDMLNEAGVEFSFMTELIAAEVAGDRVTHAVFHAKSGIFAVEADVFIDCTGDGDLSAYAGAEFLFGDTNGTVMPSTLCSFWGNIDWERVNISNTDFKQTLQAAFDNGVFRNNDPFHVGIFPIGEHLGGGNIGHLYNLNPLDEESLTDGLIEGRKQAKEFEHYYRNYIPGYEKAELVLTASLLGIRASRRILCDYILDIEDFRARRSFEDEIGRHSNPIDIHPLSTDQKAIDSSQALMDGSLHYEIGESYGVPYSCLTVKGFKNLLTAGRCISTDQYMQGSIRVMPGCFLTGQASGSAASLALKTNGDIRTISIKDLQDKLRLLGACLP